MQKYLFKNIRLHSDSVYSKSTNIFNELYPQWEEAFSGFSDFFDQLSSQPISIERNVKMLLATRFINHIISGLILAERGLISDSIVCERSAVETLAGYKLIVADSNLAQKYNSKKFPQPSEVRRKLIELGYSNEVENIKGIYKSASGITHLNRDHERFSMDWINNRDGILYIAGNFNEKDIKHMMEFFPTLIHWFLMPLQKDS